MPTVLCIAYLFPPRAGVGVQRITKFVRYLPDHGWSPIVLTPEKPSGSFPVDSSYKNEIPSSVKVHTAPSYEPYHLYRSLGGRKRQDAADFRNVLEGGKKLGSMGRLYSAFQSAFLIPDPKIGWFKPALNEARKILGSYRVDLIFSTSPEATDHVIARAVARESGLPWVMDFRDPWTTSLYATKRPGWAQAREDELELNCLRESAGITVVQNRYRDEYLEKYPELKMSAGKFKILPNGFDPSDFEDIKPREFDKWTVVYTGSIGYPRDPVPFFKAWKLACEKSVEFRDNAGCLFMGEFDSNFREMAPSYIGNNLSIEGFQDRGSVLSTQLGAGALLLLAEGYVTGKAYEYVAAVTRGAGPIIAITTGVDLIDLVNNSKTGVCFSPEDISGLSASLLELYYSRGKSVNVNHEFLTRYDRRRITGELAEIFNDLIE